MDINRWACEICRHIPYVLLYKLTDHCPWLNRQDVAVIEVIFKKGSVPMPKHGWGDILKKAVHNVYGKWNRELDRVQFKEDAASIDTYWNWGLASGFIKHSLDSVSNTMISPLPITRNTPDNHNCVDVLDVALVRPEWQFFRIIPSPDYTVRRLQRIIDMAVRSHAPYVTKTASKVAVMPSGTHNLRQRWKISRPA